MDMLYVYIILYMCLQTELELWMGQKLTAADTASFSSVIIIIIISIIIIIIVFASSHPFIFSPGPHHY